MSKRVEDDQIVEFPVWVDNRPTKEKGPFKDVDCFNQLNVLEWLNAPREQVLEVLVVCREYLRDNGMRADVWYENQLKQLERKDRDALQT